MQTHLYHLITTTEGRQGKISALLVSDRPSVAELYRDLRECGVVYCGQVISERPHVPGGPASVTRVTPYLFGVGGVGCLMENGRPIDEGSLARALEGFDWAFDDEPEADAEGG